MCCAPCVDQGDAMARVKEMVRRPGAERPGADDNDMAFAAHNTSLSGCPRNGNAARSNEERAARYVQLRRARRFAAVNHPTVSRVLAPAEAAVEVAVQLG